MLLALGATAIVIIALLWEVAMPLVFERIARWRARRALVPVDNYDPGRERRAEQRARSLLRSCVDEEDWEMYRDLGFLRVWGRQADGPDGPEGPEGPEGPASGGAGAPYAYLIYPHKPVVAYLPQTSTLLSEYCVQFLDHSRPHGSARLPDSDDVLAKWMALTGDERRMIANANMHLPGRQVDPNRVRRDLWRLSRWERERMQETGRRAGRVPAP
jgi:hypothetical protein